MIDFIKHRDYWQKVLDDKIRIAKERQEKKEKEEAVQAEQDANRSPRQIVIEP